jgi:hypothetical protein
VPLRIEVEAPPVTQSILAATFRLQGEVKPSPCSGLPLSSPGVRPTAGGYQTTIPGNGAS